MLLPMNRIHDELNKVDNYRNGKKESTVCNYNEDQPVSVYLESILEYMIENQETINDDHKQSPSKSYFEYSADLMCSDLYFEFMSVEDKIKFKKLLSTPVTTDFAVQTMDNSIDKLERIYGKENVQNLLKNDQ